MTARCNVKTKEWKMLPNKRKLKLSKYKPKAGKCNPKALCGKNYSCKSSCMTFSPFRKCTKHISYTPEMSKMALKSLKIGNKHVYMFLNIE